MPDKKKNCPVLSFSIMKKNILSKIPIQLFLIVPFVIQIILAMGLTGYLSFRYGQQAVNDLTIQLHNEITFRIQQQLKTYLPHNANTIRIDHLHELLQSRFGETFIIERSGLMVASSKPFNGKQRIRADESQEPLIRLAFQRLTDLNEISDSHQLEFEIDGERHFLQVLPIGQNLDWLIITTISEAEFMQPINTNIRMTILITLLAIGIAIGVGILTARWITLPILTLNSSTKAQGVLLERTDKVGDLAHSFNYMVSQLQETFQTLEKRVKERTAELAKAKEKAEVANQAKSAFLANMSHELRSPLNAILGFTQIMIRSQTLPQEHIENLNIISRSGEHLLTLINQVLDLSKIEAGHMSLNEKNFDLYRLLDEVIDMFQLKANDKHLQLLFERQASVPQYVRTDEVKLRQVLINLLNNALKFTNEGTIYVRIKPVETYKLMFEVEDTGPGIAPAELDNLFKAFVQTQTGQQTQEGTGLGLAISRQFIQYMGGDIQVESQEGRGTIFKFDIRVNLVEASEVAEPDKRLQRRVIALEAGQPHYHILIVDDKWTNRQLLIKLLKPLGFEVREAANGLEAIEIWKEFEPQLIWMDMRMPVMDGYEATQKIKATTKGQATAIIALTASTLSEQQTIALSAGCDDFLRKPFREADIFELMKKHIGVRYVYEEVVETIAPTQVLTPEMLTVLPSEWITALREAAERADADVIYELLEQIKPEHAPLAQSIAALVDDFEFDELIEIGDKSPTMNSCFGNGAERK
jgi:signal transduction histidine kinase/CheY-like chemotaxis protein